MFAIVKVEIKKFSLLYCLEFFAFIIIFTNLDTASHFTLNPMKPSSYKLEKNLKDKTFFYLCTVKIRHPVKKENKPRNLT